MKSQTQASRQLLKRIAPRVIPFPSRADIPIFLLGTMTFVAYAVSPDPRLSVSRFWGMLLGIVIFYAVRVYVQSEDAAFHAVSLLCLLTIVVALGSLVTTDWNRVRLLNLNTLYEHIPRMVVRAPSGEVPYSAAALLNPRQVGSAMAMLLPLSLGLVFSNQRNYRIIAIVALLIGTIVLLLSQSLQGLFGLSLALLLFAGTRYHWQRVVTLNVPRAERVTTRWLWLVVPLGLLLLVTALWFFVPPTLLADFFSSHNPLGVALILRIDIWNRALAMIHDMPLTGVGLNAFPLLIDQFYPGFLIGPEPHAHNIFLQTAVDLGLIGLGALIWLVIEFFGDCLRAYRLSDNSSIRALMLGVAGSVLAFLGNGLLDTSPLGGRTSLALWAILGTGIALGESFSRRETRSLSVRNRNTRTKLLAGFAFTAFLIPLVLSLIPGFVFLNQRLVMLNQAVYLARTYGRVENASLGMDARSLEALPLLGKSAQLEGSLGTLYAWRGEEEKAFAALQHRVQLDSVNALSDYAPFEVWRRYIAGEKPGDAADNLLMIYQQWSMRYPQRAENYVLVAIVWQSVKQNRVEAIRVLCRGAQQEAEPRELLLFHIQLLTNARAEKRLDAICRSSMK